jgi:large subunit ribosomal protein L21
MSVSTPPDSSPSLSVSPTVSAEGASPSAVSTSDAAGDVSTGAATAPPAQTATKERVSPSAVDPADAVDYAIVETGGQQFWLQPNRYVDLDRLEAEVDSTLTLNTVLLLKDGKGITLGQPFIQGASVELKVLAHRRGPKILVYKMRRKKKTRRKTGHRQDLTRVLVQAIRNGR